MASLLSFLWVSCVLPSVFGLSVPDLRNAREALANISQMGEAEVAEILVMADAVLARLTEEDVKDLLRAVAHLELTDMQKVDPAEIVADMKGRKADELLGLALQVEGGKLNDMLNRAGLIPLFDKIMEGVLLK